MRYTLLRLTVAALTGSALPAAAQDVPATSATITTSLEQSAGGDSDQVIYVTNLSSRPIVVTSVRLMECENVQGNCGTRRMKIRVSPGNRVSVQRVRPRNPDQGTGFRYAFTWEEEAAEGPTAKDLAKDSTALEVDTVIVMPKLVDLKVGETLDLGQVLSITAKNRAGKVFPQVYFTTQIALGEDFIALNGPKLTGKAAGTAALVIWASLVAGPSPPPKSTTRILIMVTP